MGAYKEREPQTSSEEFLKKHRDIVRLLREKHSIRNAAKIA